VPAPAAETAVAVPDAPVPPADDAPARLGLPTRPGAVGRAGRRVRPAKDLVRFTLDLDRQQHLFLRMFALQHGIEASKVCRELLTQLESNPDLAELVLDGLLGVYDDEPADDAGASQG
jgi:hypothetical protein